MTTKHTPGPWKFHFLHLPFEHKTKGYAGCLAQVDYERPYPNSGLLAHVRAETIFKDECEANARLIAAAPELLEACKAVIRCNNYALSGPVDPEFSHVLRQVSAAIAKAEGRE